MDRYFDGVGRSARDYPLDNQIVMFIANVSAELHSQATRTEISQSPLVDQMTTCSIAILGTHMLGRLAFRDATDERKLIWMTNCLSFLLTNTVGNGLPDDEATLGKVSAVTLHYQRLSREFPDLAQEVDGRWSDCFLERTELAMPNIVETWHKVRALV